MKAGLHWPLRVFMLVFSLLLCAACTDDGKVAGPGDPPDTGDPKVCEGGCASSERCEKGECVLCPSVCGNECCEDDFVCDQYSNACTPKCKDGRSRCDSVCCDTGFECTAQGKCAKPCILDECTNGEVCAGGYCTACSGQVCAGECCKAGELCDKVLLMCMPSCGQNIPTCNLQCCGSDMYCSNTKNSCWKDCPSGKDPCQNNGALVCCAQNQECVNNACIPSCEGLGPRCGAKGAELCCDVGELCDSVTNSCIKSCGTGTTLCAGTTCCNNNSQLCMGNKCIDKGKACQNDAECSWTQFCDKGSQTCVEFSDSPNHCVYIPPVGQFTPQAQWQFKESVLGSAIAINLTDDNDDAKIDENDIPDVVFVTQSGKLVVLSGDTGKVLAQSDTKLYAYRNDLGAAKVDADEYPEIVVGSQSKTEHFQYIINLIPDGSGYKLVEKAKLPITRIGENADLHPSFVDVDADKHIEIVTTQGILKDDMTWKCQFKVGKPKTAEDSSMNPSINMGYNVGYSENYLDDVIVADLDGDGQAEIISAAIFNNKCEVIVPRSQGGGHHYAVADLLENSNEPGELAPEILRVRNIRGTQATVELWKVYKSADAWSSKKIKDAVIPINKERAKIETFNGMTADCDQTPNSWVCNAWGGPPTIADFDGDGKRDIGLASTWYYVVYRNDLSILWQDGNITDFSSGRTGSSVFDFEGDGISEVVYRDELNLRIYSGPGDNGKPKILYETSSTSATVTEYPLIVDVDNDGNTEIVMVSNEGVTAYRDTADNWVRTRRVWNQHSYHVSHINEGGSVPMPEPANWLNPKLNNYRQNVQSEGMFNAPDLVAEAMNFSLSKCSEGTIVLTAQIKNQGSIAVAAGVNIAFYIEKYGTDQKTVFLGEVQTTKALGPGTTQNLSLDWKLTGQVLPELSAISVSLPQRVSFMVDAARGGKLGASGDHNECKEDNNRLANEVLVSDCPAN